MTKDDITTVYRQYGARLRARCRRMLGDTAATDDAVQETLIRLWRYGDAFLTATSPLAWLYRVAERCCLDQLAERRRHHELQSALGALSHDDVRAGDAVETRELLLHFLAPLDERTRQIAILRYLDEVSGAEIALITGWSRQTIWKKLMMLRGRCRDRAVTW